MPVIAWYYREQTQAGKTAWTLLHRVSCCSPGPKLVCGYCSTEQMSKYISWCRPVRVFSRGGPNMGGRWWEISLWCWTGIWGKCMSSPYILNILKHKWMLISSSFSWKGPGSMTPRNNKHTDLGSFPNKRNRGNLGKWMVPRLKQEKYKMSLEHQVLAESTEMTKEWWRDTRRVQEPAWRGFRCRLWNNLSIDLEETIEHWIMMAMDYNILNKRVHEFTLINIK